MPPIYQDSPRKGTGTPGVRSAAGLHPRAQERPDKLNAKLVYALWDQSALKVGCTDKNPQQRLQELQTGNPRKLQLLAYTSHVTEAMAHAALGSCHLRGEWFCAVGDSLRYVNTWDWVDKKLMAQLMKDCASGW